MSPMTAALVVLGACGSAAFPHRRRWWWPAPGTGVSGATGALMLLSLCQVVGALASGRLAGHAGLLLPSAGCAITLLIAGVVLAARQARGFDADTAVLLVACGAMAVLVGTLWALAVAVDKADEGRVAAERQRNQMCQPVAAAVTHDLRSPLLAATLSTVLLRRMVEQPHARAAIDRLERTSTARRARRSSARSITPRAARCR